ncbi:MAG TPA: SPOR domain-containing protein, partial [Gemmatimonadales bacterium]|nr:SPOR domain-containing protein [Gemmatimonadales bacterium]
SGRRALMRPLAITSVLLGAILLGARTLPAQTDPQLRQAVSLAQDGNRDSALVLLRAVRAATDEKSPRYAEALYTAGILATDPDSMRRTLQQVVVEHSLTPWADDALLRLAQLHYAGGNLPAAMRDLERLRTDFPRSDVFADAAFWAARTYFDAHQEKSGCEWVGMGLARVADGSATIRDQLQAFTRRCSESALAEGRAKAPPGAPRDTVVLVSAGTVDSGRVTRDAVDAGRGTRDTVPVSRPLTLDSEPSTQPESRVPQPESVFRVQVVAAGTRALANETATRVRALGYEALIAEEGGFLKVRAGGFATREGAAAAQRRLEKDFPGAFIVKDQ